MSATVKKRHKSQKQKVAAHLNRYGWISTERAFERYRIQHLARRIMELRNEGWGIETVPDKKAPGTYRYELREKPKK